MSTDMMKGAANKAGYDFEEPNETTVSTDS